MFLGWRTMYVIWKPKYMFKKKIKKNVDFLKTLNPRSFLTTGQINSNKKNVEQWKRRSRQSWRKDWWGRNWSMRNSISRCIRVCIVCSFEYGWLIENRNCRMTRKILLNTGVQNLHKKICWYRSNTGTYKFHYILIMATYLHTSTW